MCLSIDNFWTGMRVVFIYNRITVVKRAVLSILYRWRWCVYCRYRCVRTGRMVLSTSVLFENIEFLGCRCVVVGRTLLFFISTPTTNKALAITDTICRGLPWNGFTEFRCFFSTCGNRRRCVFQFCFRSARGLGGKLHFR